MYFKAKKVFWNQWVLWFTLIIAWFLYVYDQHLIAIGLGLICIGVFAYMFRNNYFFYISEKELICKGGMFFKRIKLKSIIGLRFSRHPFFVFAPFKYMFRVKIRYINDHGKVAHYFVSVYKKEEFFSLLMEKCYQNQL